MARFRSVHWFSGMLGLFAMLAAACSLGAAPTPLVVERQVIQTVEVTRIVEVPQQVIETQIVEVTPGPESFSDALLEGRWVEYWGVGDDLDLGYNDTYEITKDTTGAILITCPDQANYEFEPAVYDGKRLLVTLNVVGRGYTIDYDMHFDQSGTLMIGTAQTNHGVLARVVWAKILE